MIKRINRHWYSIPHGTWEGTLTKNMVYLVTKHGIFDIYLDRGINGSAPCTVVSSDKGVVIKYPGGEFSDIEEKEVAFLEPPTK